MRIPLEIRVACAGLNKFRPIMPLRKTALCVQPGAIKILSQALSVMSSINEWCIHRIGQEKGNNCFHYVDVVEYKLRKFASI
jgi:hypothetical protein